jgi:hypothetical protein
MRYEGLSVRQIQLAECAAVSKAHQCSRAPAVKIISKSLLRDPIVRAKAERPAFLVEQAVARRREPGVATKVTTKLSDGDPPNTDRLANSPKGRI